MKLQIIITAGILLLSALTVNAAQQVLNSTDNVGVQRGKINSNFTDNYTNKADKSATVMLWSEWADGASFTTSSPPVAYNGSLYKCTAPYTKVAGETPDTQTEYFAEVTGTGGGIAHAPADGNFYASKNNAWASLAGAFAPPLGTDDNYVTDAEKIKLGNLSGTNTGDQDLSGYALTSSVLSKTNTTAFTPTADFHPVPKKYVDDSITASGGYTDEQAQDAAGAMFSGNTETGITVTYDDATGKVNFVVPTTLASFTDDATHRLVTDTEKSTWNAKQNALIAGTDYLAPTGIGASLTFTATGFNGNLATTTNTVQELADAVDDLALGSGADDQTAAEVSVADTAGYYTATNVETVLAEIGADPFIAWDTSTITEQVGVPNTRTNTIGVKSGVFQAADPQLDTWAGVSPGTGIAAAIAVNADTVGGLPVTIAKGAYTVDTASIAANTCASAVAVTATGVATTDTIIASPSAIISSVTGFGVTTAGAVRVDVYPTSGNVNFQFCNPTGAAIDPGSVTFNWKVIR